MMLGLQRSAEVLADGSRLLSMLDSKLTQGGTRPVENEEEGELRSAKSLQRQRGVSAEDFGAAIALPTLYK